MTLYTKNKKVCGVGINDANYAVQPTVNGKRFCCPYYRAWKNMIVRCYDNKRQEKYPTYIGCTVSDEWLLFSNFSKWMQNQNWQGKCLDKDILKKGNKVYSADTCVFVDNVTNCFMNEQDGSRGDLPLGVYMKEGRIVAACRNPITGKKISLGSFTCKKQAHAAWISKKREMASVIASNQSDARVAAEILSRYK